MSSVADLGPSRTARIDLAALALNLRRFESDAPFVVDARADAFGHGLMGVAPIALAAGATSVRVSEPDPEWQLASGFPDAFFVGFDAPDGAARFGPLRLAAAAAYGLDPDVDTAPALTLVGEVIAVKTASAGSGVSYGYTHRTATDTVLALVGLGYADGVPRLGSNRAEVLVGGDRRPVVGRIAMDQLVVDVGKQQIEPGDEVVLFGDPATGAPSAIEWAEWTDRTPLQLTAGLGRRIRRVAVGNGAAA